MTMKEQDKTKTIPELFGQNTKQKLSRPTSPKVYFSLSLLMQMTAVSLPPDL